MKHSFFLSALASTIALASALTACGSRVICEGTMCGGGNGGSNAVPGSSGNPGQGGSMGTGPGVVDSAILYGTDPLTLRFTSFPLTCSDPEQKSSLDQCGWYSLEITFPASLLQPGPLDISNPSLNVTEYSAGMPRSADPDDCGRAGAVGSGGGSSLGGTITFVSIAPDSVVLDVQGVTTFMTDGFDLDGMRTAPRCQ